MLITSLSSESLTPCLLPVTFKTKSDETRTLLYEYEIWSLILRRRVWLAFESKVHRIKFMPNSQREAGGCGNVIIIVVLACINK
jgi:hypothetical protein